MYNHFEFRKQEKLFFKYKFIMNTHVSSGAIVYKRENGIIKILLLHRDATDSWHLPKGTQNLGESIEQTAIREVNEETGLNIELGEYIGKLNSVYTRNDININKETHYFLAYPLDGDLKTHDHEHDTVRFLEYSIALSHLEHFSLFEEEGKILKMAEPRFV